MPGDLAAAVVEDQPSPSPSPSTGLLRAAGVALAVAALLILGAFAALLLDDREGAVALVLLLAVVTVPVLGAALLSGRAVVVLLRGGPPLPRTVVCAGLLGIGHVGVAAIALQPDEQGVISDAKQLAAGVGAVGLCCAVLALAAVLPGRSFGLRLVVGLSAAVLLLGLVVLRAVAATG